MPTRNVVITQHQAELIDELVSIGKYQNASEVLRDGLRLVEHREKTEAVKLAALREAVQLGLDQLEAGLFREVRDDELDDFIAELGRLAEERVRQAS